MILQIKQIASGNPRGEDEVEMTTDKIARGGVTLLNPIALSVHPILAARNP
jgi:hypothetical protein